MHNITAAEAACSEILLSVPTVLLMGRIREFKDRRRRTRRICLAIGVLTGLFMLANFASNNNKESFNVFQFSHRHSYASTDGLTPPLDGAGHGAQQTSMPIMTTRREAKGTRSLRNCTNRICSFQYRMHCKNTCLLSAHIVMCG